MDWSNFKWNLFNSTFLCCSVLFPYTRSFTPQCIPTQLYKFVRVSGGTPAMDYRPKQGCMGKVGGGATMLLVAFLMSKIARSACCLGLEHYLLLYTIVQTFDDIWDFYCPSQGCTVAKPNLPQYNMGALSKKRRGGGVGRCVEMCQN